MYLVHLNCGAIRIFYEPLLSMFILLLLSTLRMCKITFCYYFDTAPLSVLSTLEFLVTLFFFQSLFSFRTFLTYGLVVHSQFSPIIILHTHLQTHLNKIQLLHYYYNAIYIEGLAISRGSLGKNRRRMGKKENLRMLQFFTRTTRSFIDQVKMVVPTHSIFTKAQMYVCIEYG